MVSSALAMLITMVVLPTTGPMVNGRPPKTYIRVTIMRLLLLPVFTASMLMIPFDRDDVANYGAMDSDVSSEDHSGGR